MYKIGEYIVKPMNGVCKVEDITHVDMPGADKNKMYYLLIPICDNTGKIYVPADTITGNSRRVMTEQEAEELIAHIPMVEEPWIENEKLRQERYKEVIRRCDPQELAGVIKMVYIRRRKRMAQGKKNTAVDERFFKMAEDNLYGELEFALHKNKGEILELIKEAALQQRAQ
jgi:CarD family transcriptional regulator